MEISKNALTVLKKRYLKQVHGAYESPMTMFKRIAKNISKTDKKYGQNYKKSEKEFFEMMSSLEFLPNTPTLRNAGRVLQQLAACFVLPVEDSIDGIFQSVKDLALIQRSGGGTGFSFSRLRPKNSIVGDTGGMASGPVSFMKVFDAATAAIKEGGTRRGANMAILRVDHPDIMEFITAKKNPSVLTNFNISVAITDKFMEAVKSGKKYSLIDPHSRKESGKLNAGKVFDALCRMAWLNGEPGVIFIDEINRKHYLKEKIESTNPCAEQPLLPYESCVLGSLNLKKFVIGKNIDYEKLKRAVRTAVHFLDNVIDMNNYPVKAIEEKTRANRKIGLGIMGWADMLEIMNMAYDSDSALAIAEKLMRFITVEARNASMELGRIRGSFPNFKKSRLYGKYKFMRNATVTTIAPAGTLNLIADCSSGIEPIFSKTFYHDVMSGARLYEKHRPKFKTAHEIRPEWHVKMQASFQKYTDNAISKTVNLKYSAKVNDVKKTYLLAYELGSKGIAVYRNKSRPTQVLNVCKKCPV